MNSIYIWILLMAITLLPTVYTYILYPVLLKILYVTNKDAYNATTQIAGYLPDIHIVMAVHNEESVLPDKIKSLISLEYDGTLYVWIGSDASTDSTDRLLDSYYSAHSANVTIARYPQRQGKIETINHLVSEIKRTSSEDALLLFTDADIILPAGLLKNAVPVFSNFKLGLLDIRILSAGAKMENVYEYKYWEIENIIKWIEGKLWGCTMGASGGCYMIRSKLFVPVPPNFLVDDFFLSMQTLKNGFSIQLEEKLFALSLTNTTIEEEFRRKRRIAAGNWQNHVFFRGFLLKSFFPVGFCYFSHKWLRWISPFLLLLNVFVLLSWGAFGTTGKLVPIVILLLSIATTCLAVLLSRLNLHWKPLEGWYYFLTMQVALAAGTYDYIKGITTNVWKPTKRIEKL